MPNKVHTSLQIQTIIWKLIIKAVLHVLGLISRNLISTQGRILINHAIGTTWKYSLAALGILAMEDCAVGILVNIFTYPYKTNRLVPSLESLLTVDWALRMLTLSRRTLTFSTSKLRKSIALPMTNKCDCCRLLMDACNILRNVAEPFLRLIGIQALKGNTYLTKGTRCVFVERLVIVA